MNYALLATLLLLLVVVVPAAYGAIPPEWLPILERLCLEFEKHIPAPLPHIIQHQVEVAPGLSIVPIAFHMPEVILWSPLEQLAFRFHLSTMCPKCEKPAPLRAIGWQNGLHGKRSEPRKIHGLNRPILLIGRVYKCTEGHDILAYHPGIMKKVEAAESFIPFRLWHRTGFAKTFMQTVESLVTIGISIS